MSTSNFDDDYIYGQMVIDKLEKAGFYHRHFKHKCYQVTDANIQQTYDIDLVGWTKENKLPDAQYLIEQKSVRIKPSSGYVGEDGFYTSMTLETWSCPRKKTRGWMYKSKATLLIYFMTQLSTLRQRAYFIDMRGLQDWWKTQDAHSYRKHTMENANRTESRIVPIEKIEPFIYYTEDLVNYRELI